MCQSHWNNVHKNKLIIKRGQFYILSLSATICIQEKLPKCFRCMCTVQQNNQFEFFKIGISFLVSQSVFQALEL